MSQCLPQQSSINQTKTNQENKPINAIQKVDNIIIIYYVISSTKFFFQILDKRRRFFVNSRWKVAASVSNDTWIFACRIFNAALMEKWNKIVINPLVEAKTFFKLDW